MANLLIESFLAILDYLENHAKTPKLSEIIIPRKNYSTDITKKYNFGAIRLEDDSFGIFYTELDPDLRNFVDESAIQKLTAMNTIDLAKLYGSQDFFLKTLGLGAINAISQSLFSRAGYEFSFNLDIIEILNLDPHDKIGMVGYFPPLVKRIERMDIPLSILELNEKLVKTEKNWEITLNPKKLKDCTKILCTSTTLLNDTLTDVITFAPKAELFTIIGPTAGFLPDALFQLGVDIVGGTVVQKPGLFLERMLNGLRWGDSTQKYVIKTKKYPGFRKLVRDAK